MKKWYYIAGLSLLAVTMVGLSCKKENKTNANNNGGGLDRKPMLENYANNYVVPAYADMVLQLTTLKAKVDAFAASPDATTLGAAKDAWRTAYITWQKVDLLEFGPAQEATLRNFVNTYPVTVSKVEANISAPSFNLEEFGNRDAQGFPALDYLLNGLTLDKYTADGNAAKRKQYLQAVAKNMLDKVSAVNSEWASYKNTFVAATGTDVNSSLSQVVNSYVMYYERYLRSGKIGYPAGAMTGTPKAELVEAYYSQDLSKELAVTALNSVKNFYAGKNYTGTATGEGMKSYLAALGTKDDNGMLMADLVETEMNQAATALSGLNGSIYGAVQTNRTQVLQAYEELQDVVPLLKVDMVSAFSISITYTDNDGD